MKRILVVEDSQLVTKIVKHVVKQAGGLEAIFATNFAEAKTILAQQGDRLFAALTDLNLPDAPDGEVVDLVLDAGVPVIVLTGSYDDERRDKILSKGIVDYVVKEGRYSYEYAVAMVQRLERNQSLSVLVVDDSATSRRYISELLLRQGFQVFSAENGKDAIRVILQQEDISLVITDYHMPEMDGVELVKNLRHKYGKSDLVVIGLSGQGDKSLSAKFIKNGANDFLQKPFNYEEFNCRVRHNVESLELIRQIRDATFKDYLTGIWSRRYFYERGELLYQDAVAGDKPVAVVIMDLDNFRQLNDTYGHAIGDCVLVQVAELLQSALQRFLVARAGGEEFYAILPGLDNDQAQSLVTQIRQMVSNRPLVLDDGTELYCTFSAGVTNETGRSLDEQIARADEYLIRAKEAGRNLVVGDDDEL